MLKIVILLVCLFVLPPFLIAVVFFINGLVNPHRNNREVTDQEWEAHLKFMKEWEESKAKKSKHSRKKTKKKN